MRFLLEVGVLVARGWSDHRDHRSVTSRIASLSARDRILKSAIPQPGFVRVSVQPTGGPITVGEAGDVLAGMLAVLGRRHEFIPDDQASDRRPGWCPTSSRTTDAHLLLLADSHEARLATLDAGIPDAYLVPDAVAWP